MKKLLSILSLFVIIHHGFTQELNDFNYPFEAIENNIEGIVSVQFYLNSEGNVIHDSIRVKEGVGYGLDVEAIKIVKTMPPWKGIYYVNKKYILPITFKMTALSNEDWCEYYVTKGNIALSKEKHEQAFSFFNRAKAKWKYNPGIFLGLSKYYAITGNEKLMKRNQRIGRNLLR
jgi:TonB family protein